MQILDLKLSEDCERWKRLIGSDPIQGQKIISVYDVLHAHYLVIDYFCQNLDGDGIGGIGPRDLNLLLSAVNRQSSGFGNLTKWTNDLEICATLFYGLIMNHPFHDANKRTALLTLLYRLWKIHRVPDSEQRNYENLALKVAANSLHDYPAYKSFKNEPDSEIRFIADFLRRNTRRVEKQAKMITYRELNMILKQFNYKLENPHNNNIQIISIKEEEQGHLFFKKPKQIVERKVGEIDFPGWTKEVGKSVLAKARKLTNLTPEKGIDSEVFFRGATPLAALIDQYKAPLQRLAKK